MHLSGKSPSEVKNSQRHRGGTECPARAAQVEGNLPTSVVPLRVNLYDALHWSHRPCTIRDAPLGSKPRAARRTRGISTVGSTGRSTTHRQTSHTRCP